MPALGTTKIPKPKKAQILAEKRVKMCSVDKLAAKHGVSIRLVNKVATTTDPEILELADEFQKRLINQAKRNVAKGLEVIEERITDPEEPLSSVIAAGRFSYDVYRLETNQPTQINQNSAAPIDRALAFARLLISKTRDERQARKIFTSARTAQIGIGATDEDWREAEAMIFDGQTG